MIDKATCPICLELGEAHSDENEKWHFNCKFCGYNSDADDSKETRRAHAEEHADACEAMADSFLSQFDDDPNPYHGTYSEE